MIRNDETYELVKDHLGSVRVVIGTADGAIAQRLDYDEFWTRAGTCKPVRIRDGRERAGPGSSRSVSRAGVRPGYEARAVRGEGLRRAGGAVDDQRSGLVLWRHSEPIRLCVRRPGEPKRPKGLYDCYYSISAHTMVCNPTEDEAHKQFYSSDFVSGNNDPNVGPCTDCQNNSSRTDVSDQGPLPVGDYDVGPQYPGSARRPLDPLGTSIFGPIPRTRRSGFQTHGCRNSATCSNGCVAATTNATRDSLNRTLATEEGHNMLHVVP